MRTNTVREGDKTTSNELDIDNELYQTKSSGLSRSNNRMLLICDKRESFPLQADQVDCYFYECVKSVVYCVASIRVVHCEF